MNLYLISQDQNTGYDTFDSAVVCAESEADAVTIHPSNDPKDWGKYCEWATSPDKVSAKHIGTAAPEMVRGVVCASFNAG